MTTRPIYFDYSATTPVDPRVVDKMVPWLYEHYGNPASRSHALGWEAEEAVEEAREQVAALSESPTGFLLDPYRRWIKSAALVRRCLVRIAMAL